MNEILRERETNDLTEIDYKKVNKPFKTTFRSLSEKPFVFFSFSLHQSFEVER
jgi:hypothetical protein